MWGQGPVIEQRPRRTRGHTERAALFSTKNAVTRGQKARQTLGGRDSSRGPGASAPSAPVSIPDSQPGGRRHGHHTAPGARGWVLPRGTVAESSRPTSWASAGAFQAGKAEPNPENMIPCGMGAAPRGGGAHGAGPLGPRVASAAGAPGSRWRGQVRVGSTSLCRPTLPWRPLGLSRGGAAPSAKRVEGRFSVTSAPASLCVAASQDERVQEN